MKIGSAELVQQRGVGQALLNRSGEDWRMNGIFLKWSFLNPQKIFLGSSLAKIYGCWENKPRRIFVAET